MALYEEGSIPEEDNIVEQDMQQEEQQYAAETESQLYDMFVRPKNSSSKNKIEHIDKEGNKTIVSRQSKYKEIFLPDLTTSNLGEYGEFFAKECAEISIGIKNLADSMGIDMSPAANYFTDLMFVETNVSKGVTFELLKTLRTSRAENSSKIEQTTKNERQKKNWFGN